MFRKCVTFVFGLLVMCAVSTATQGFELGSQEVTVVKTEINSTLEGYLFSEYLYQMDFYTICQAPGKCATLGSAADLKLTDEVDDPERMFEFFPSEQQYIKVVGDWNIMSDNTVMLDTTKPFEIWGKANNAAKQDIEVSKVFPPMDLGI